MSKSEVHPAKANWGDQLTVTLSPRDIGHLIHMVRDDELIDDHHRKELLAKLHLGLEVEFSND